MPQILESLRSKLANSPSEPGVLQWHEKLSLILSDNQVPFFPNFTDHGPTHVDRVLRCIVERLIPAEVMEILGSADAAVLVCAALLHDAAMHLRPAGLVELLRGKTDHRSPPWFKQRRGRCEPELSWPDEWRSYIQEVRRFNDQDFLRIVGRLPSSDELHKWMTGQTLNPAEWLPFDFLVIGEFVRRHHGRLAHEIAMFGFPGLTDDEFPTLARTLPLLADIAGLVARSHSLPLRDAVAYLGQKHQGEIRPRGTFAVYHMALLRIADYLQLESERAPAILFKLRAPESMISVDEWNKHGAVAHVSYLNQDPGAIKIELATQHSLRIHLQMIRLIEGLQTELDVSTAVLSEIYGRVAEEAANKLRISKNRVLSNYADESMTKDLPYVALPFSLGADPRLLALVIEPLYGPFPEIGIRELTQNAVDAVHERAFLEGRNDSPAVPHVLTEFFEDPVSGWLFRITDRGVGMTAETVGQYFLKAGASFRDSHAWKSTFADELGHSQIPRSGRFGIGVFAGFLLGNTLRVTTRHLREETGFTFEVTRGSSVIELHKREGLPIGTVVSIQLSTATKKWLDANHKGESWDWYCLDYPVVRRIVRRDWATQELNQAVKMPSNPDAKGSTNFIEPKGYGPVFWAAKDGPLVACNGIKIAAVEKIYDQNRMKLASCNWPKSAFRAPVISINDPDGVLPLTLTRDRIESDLSFIPELLADVARDFIAYAVAGAPPAPAWTSLVGYDRRYPLAPESFEWICTQEGATVLDRWTLATANIGRLLVTGYVSLDRGGTLTSLPISPNFQCDCAVWPVGLGRSEREPDRSWNQRDRDREQKEVDPSEAARQTILTFVKRVRERRSVMDVIGAVAVVGKDRLTRGEVRGATLPLSDLLNVGADADFFFDWDTGAPAQRLPYAIELILGQINPQSEISSMWSSIVRQPMIPFDAEQRRLLVETVGKNIGTSGRL